MSLTLTQQFLNYLEATFGITVDASDLTWGDGSSVNDSTVQQKAVSTTPASPTGSSVSAAPGNSTNFLSYIFGGAGLLAPVSNLFKKQTSPISAATAAATKADATANAINQIVGTDNQMFNSVVAYNNNIGAITKSYTALTTAQQKLLSDQILGSSQSVISADQQAVSDLTMQVNNQVTAQNLLGQQLQLGLPPDSIQPTVLFEGSDGLPTAADFANGNVAPISTDPIFSKYSGDLSTQSQDAIAKQVADTTATTQKPNAQPTGILGKIKNWWSNLPDWVQGVGYTAFAGFTGYELYSGISSLIQKFSVGGLIQTLGSFIGLAKAFALLHAWMPDPNIGATFLEKFGQFITGKMGFGIVVGVIVLLAILLTTVLKDKKPAAVELPVVSMPTVWTTQAVLFIGVGIALAGVGITIGPNAAVTQTVTVPTVQLSSALNASGLTDTNGNPIGVNGFSLYGSVFVSKGTGSSGQDQVMYITPGANNTAVAHVDELKKGLTFAAPSGPDSLYINLFKGSTINPDAVNGLQAQAALTQAAPQLGDSSAATAMTLAGAANKSATASSSGH